MSAAALTSLHVPPPNTCCRRFEKKDLSYHACGGSGNSVTRLVTESLSISVSTCHPVHGWSSWWERRKRSQWPFGSRTKATGTQRIAAPSGGPALPIRRRLVLTSRRSIETLEGND